MILPSLLSYAFFDGASSYSYAISHPCEDPCQQFPYLPQKAKLVLLPLQVFMEPTLE